jgi:hypothetical protein
MGDRRGETNVATDGGIAVGSHADSRPGCGQQITGVPGCVGFGPGRSYRDGYPG